MKIFYYCQHVLGVGHLFRTLEICKALSRHQIVFVTGGQPVNTALPAHVREFQLPSLMMDREFKGLRSEEKNQSLLRIKRKRRQTLFSAYKAEAPDIFLMEFYPFGRRSFAFELNPVIKAIRHKLLKPSRVICSLRDILVERKKYQPFYENGVVDLLNTYFDAVLVHSDPSVLPLDETFSRLKNIQIPVVYTGFVTQKPPARARTTIRRQIGIVDDERLLVASIGGGQIGGRLLTAVLAAFKQGFFSPHDHLIIFAGPFMPEPDYRRLLPFHGKHIHVERFTDRFLSFLAAADLSISMAGYNTCMNILAARVPALVWPFEQNREQRLRAERLSEMASVRVLENEDLDPARLGPLMMETMTDPFRLSSPIDLEGAEKTASWLESCIIR